MPSSHSNAPALSRDQFEHIVALLRADAVDAAIQAGLMDGWADACADVLEPDARSLLLAARVRLRTAWEARARYEARNARLARRDAEREAARRRAVPAPVTGDGTSTRPALPPNAASILARAKARAAGRTP